MDPGSWGSALTTVVACGDAGAFIDFWIGRTGEQRVRGWLEYWIKLSYVRWGNFGREEALFAVRVMDRLFGRGGCFPCNGFMLSWRWAGFL